MSAALGEHLDRYLRVRRALGYRLVEHGRLLRRFVAELDARGHTTISVDAALAWAATASTDQATARRLSAVRRFARYVAAFDSATEIPPANLTPGGPGRQPSRLYSADEVAGLMDAARGLRPALWAAGFETMIGLLAATGIRPGEAYRLNRTDVDLAAGRLAVMHTKFGKSRRLPLHPSTVDALGSYAQARDHAADPAQEAFFLTPTGRRVGSQQAAGTLHRLADRAGIESPEGRRPPRLYDFRHSFAVNTLLDWHRQGVDVWERLPVLSAYLGHLRPANTYWYLEAAPELMALVADRLAQAWDQRP